MKENPHSLFVFIQSNLGSPSPLNFINFTFPFTSTLAIMALSLIFREAVYHQCHILKGRKHFCKHLQSKHFKCSLCLFALYFSLFPDKNHVSTANTGMWFIPFNFFSFFSCSLKLNLSRWQGANIFSREFELGSFPLRDLKWKFNSYHETQSCSDSSLDSVL